MGDGEETTLLNPELEQIHPADATAVGGQEAAGTTLADSVEDAKESAAAVEVEGLGTSTESLSQSVLGAEIPETSPRRPPPDLPELHGPLLTGKAERPPRDVHALLGPDPWMPGGCGILSPKKADHDRSMHFDSLWKAETVRLSPDRTSATCRGRDFGGLVASTQPLDRKPFGRWFEVLIEETCSDRWADGLGIGVATISSRDTALSRVKNMEHLINGFAYELIPESWLVGYDGRAKFKGLSRYLQVSEVTGGVWKPSELRSGDVLGLLVTPDGDLMLFVNEEVRYFVKCGNIPWKSPICAVLDLDGCTQSVHLLDSNGQPPNKVMQGWAATTKAGRLDVAE